MAGELGSKAFSMPSPTTPTTYKATQKKGEVEYVQPMCASFNVQLSLFTAKVFLELPPAVKNLFLLTDEVQRRKFFTQ